jgi:hypothetical protein
MRFQPVNERYLDNETFRYKARKRIYTVWLLYVEQGEWLMYWCPDCRNSIAQYKGDLIMEHPGADETGTYIKPKSPPIMIQCGNPSCGRKIMFQGIVKRA